MYLGLILGETMRATIPQNVSQNNHHSHASHTTHDFTKQTFVQNHTKSLLLNPDNQHTTTSHIVTQISTSSPTQRTVTKTPRKSRDVTSPSLFGRLLNIGLVTAIYTAIGLVIDVSIHLVKVVIDPVFMGLSWLFLPIMAVLGFVLALLFDTKALDGLFMLFRQHDYDDINQASIGYDILKSIGFALLVMMTCWLAMILFI